MYRFSTILFGSLVVVARGVPMRRRSIFAICSLVTLCLTPIAPAQEAARGKKLIEWGWDQPGTWFMRTNIQKMEQLPFDGVVFHATSNISGNISHDIWGSRKFELAEFQHAIDDLKATPFKRLTDRFLRVNVTPGNVDWFDDRAWAVVQHNFTVAAQIVKQGGCKGFLFDTEQYTADLFSCTKQKHLDTKPLAKYQAKVRQRGRQWIKAVNEQYPDITILMPYMYVATERAPVNSPIWKNLVSAPDIPPPSSRSALLADFIDGMLDVCSPQTKLVDMWEGAYDYKQEKQFLEAYKIIRTTAITWSHAPDKYRQHVRAGFGIWMDHLDRGSAGWQTDDVSKNFFTPAQFQESVRYALQTSDEYVWIYTEQPKWWTGERLPKAYIDALIEAREKHDTN